MVESIKTVLMRRDGMSEDGAKDSISEAREEVISRIMNGEDPSDICEEYWGLEPDYLEELLMP